MFIGLSEVLKKEKKEKRIYNNLVTFLIVTSLGLVKCQKINKSSCNFFIIIFPINRIYTVTFVMGTKRLQPEYSNKIDERKRERERERDYLSTSPKKL